MDGAFLLFKGRIKGGRFQVIFREMNVSENTDSKQR